MVASSTKAPRAIAALRRAEPPDAAPLAALMQEAYGLYLPRMDRPPAPMLQDYRAVIATGQAHVLDGESTLNAAIICDAEDDHLMVETVAVSPGLQGKGIGRALMFWAEQHALAQGLTAIRLYTNAVMTENIHFYQKLNYRVTHRLREQGYQRVYFEKRLSSA